MPYTCFSYEPDMSPGPGTQDAAQSAPSSRRMMVTTHCFNYPADVQSDSRKLDDADPALRRMPISTCFRY
jgi:hypothetical protein